ncbi:hypothetical protein FHX49_002182 [Microbacterium endophyticum]|uniref:Transcriptional regulator, AbiEi antitoxin, Type IV TA system n=1 Tax=Microbacterium endophyticum TaxID=1526412 RepID=A0A7W4V4A3_9MICO|nr:type IV toxin-antitoxin system AbiEi family antitoxin domain-containing protein [Microbacterium endophyticum]MBB2976603.1 hypothetical protein [Microbacterium endophyticum]NIK37514.1 hypothetical protein [Microbacterium endophyticum]
MPRHLARSKIETALVMWSTLRDAGWSERSIRAAVAEGALHRVRRGIYVTGTLWRELWPESRHLLHTLAVLRASNSEAVVASHSSAAVLHGLPLYRVPTPRVHLTVGPDVRISSSPDVMRHVADVDAADVVVRFGHRCTSLERTVFDLACTLNVEAATASADAALRSVALAGNLYDEIEAEKWRSKMITRAAATGVRGIRSARRVVEFCDGRAQLPGESVSRVQLARLGFVNVRLQVPVAAPGGGSYYLDFELGKEAFGEFDGKDKYLDEAMRSGRTIEQVLLAEKSREDWIRGATQRKFARWGHEHIRTPQDLAQRLSSFHIFPN